MAYTTVAVQRTAAKPKFIDTTTVHTEPMTEEQPLIAHAHGVRCGKERSRTRKPYENGTPRRMPSGASPIAVIRIRTVSGSPMHVRTTNGEASVKIAM